MIANDDLDFAVRGTVCAAVLALLILKATGCISCSWWWVTCPLWGGIVVVVILCAVALARGRW
jgi:hypothetical protein